MIAFREFPNDPNSTFILYCPVTKEAYNERTGSRTSYETEEEARQALQRAVDGPAREPSGEVIYLDQYRGRFRLPT